MDSIRVEAIKAVDQLSRPFPDLLTQIQFGMEFNHRPWLREGFGHLVSRKEFLSLEEAEKLGFEDTFRCMGAGDTYMDHRHPAHYSERDTSMSTALRKWFTGDTKLFGDKETPPAPRPSIQFNARLAS